ncbi:hypothetical protein BC826DRAFT_49662 [Russula brevipes]|nr:hypothetical protein BC826DRAFT_49662 [Russula brevipes]
MSATRPVPQDIAEIAAPLLLGTIWNWALYGVLVVQVYVYSYNFPGDRKLLKLLVYAIFLIETLQTALSGADLYYWFVSGFGNMDHLASPYAAAFDVPIIGAVVALTVQYFFAYRVWILSGKKSWWLCLAICVCSTIYATAAISAGIYAHVTQKFAFGRTLKVFSYNWVIANAMADILITSAMFYYLTRQRGAEGRHFSNHMLSRIVRLTVETNLLTTADGIATLLLVVIFPNKNWYACPTAFLGKL